MAHKRRTDRFSPDEIEWLAYRAKGCDLFDQVPLKMRWIFRKYSPDEAREELLHRFMRLAATLINVCLTGKVSPTSSYQKTFLRMFASEGVDPNDVAVMLKHRLKGVSKQDLMSIAQLSILRAIDSSRTNIAATIVQYFYEEIKDLIKDPLSTPSTRLLRDTDADKPFEDEVLLNIDISTLPKEARDWIESFLSGEDVGPPPESLVRLMKDYI